MSTSTLLSFHNSQALKEKYVSRLQEHRRLEHLVQRIGWSGTNYEGTEPKGCAVGCTLENYDHTLYPSELGLPEWLAHLEDYIFEGLPKGKAEQFAEDFLSVIPVGVDIDGNRVWQRLAILRHTRDLERLKDHLPSEAKEAFLGVISWLERGEPEEEREAVRKKASWSSCWSASYLACWSSCWSSCWSASWSSAGRSASWSACWSASGSASWSAPRSDTRSAPKSAFYSAEIGDKAENWRWEAATLLQLLKECK
jgi:hypothetical protein